MGAKGEHGDPRRFTAPDADIAVLADSDDTGELWSFFEYRAEAGFEGPPPHWHDELVEGFYLVEGTMTATIDGETRTITAGEYLVGPTRTVHSFTVPEDGPARFHLQISPGGFEGYFAELERLMAAESSWPPADMAPLQELMGRYDTHAPPVA